MANNWVNVGGPMWSCPITGEERYSPWGPPPAADCAMYEDPDDFVMFTVYWQEDGVNYSQDVTHSWLESVIGPYNPDLSIGQMFELLNQQMGGVLSLTPLPDAEVLPPTSPPGGGDDGIQIQPPSGGGGGGRARSSASSSTLVRGDEGLVREAVKATLAAMVGEIDEKKLDRYMQVYRNAEKDAFDKRKSQQIDPLEVVKAEIRKSGAYQARHQLRPEEFDEMTWISSRQGAMVNAGMNAEEAQRLGMFAAQVGASLDESVELGEMSELQRKQSAEPGLVTRFRNSARAAFGVIR